MSERRNQKPNNSLKPNTMIELERIHMQHQEEEISYAALSRRSSGENPGLRITKVGPDVIWELVGLRDGDIETVDGEPRATHIDFYVGVEDIIDQRTHFPLSLGQSLGITVDGLRNPLSSVREEGKAIRWERPIGRVQIETAEAVIRPNLLSTFHDPSWINIDGQTAPYPIVSSISRRQTTKQLHFGISQEDLSATRTRRRNPTCKIVMTEDQYATILEAIDLAIAYYIQNFGRGQVV